MDYFIVTDKELEELSSRAREDGQRLFAVSNTLHRIGLVGITLLGIAGAIGGMALMSKGGGQVMGGFLTLAVTAVVCWLVYLGVALSTSLSRVLVHSMFCMLSTCETLRRDERRRDGDNPEAT
jgi:hypothetical protein